MIKNEVRSQMVNELCNVAQLVGERAQLYEQMGKIVDKYLSRLSTREDTLTQDAYHNPMVKLMRSEAYNKGCYGCSMSFKDRRHWRCLAETETDSNLNYPNASKDECKYYIAKRKKS